MLPIIRLFTVCGSFGDQLDLQVLNLSANAWVGFCVEGGIVSYTSTARIEATIAVEVPRRTSSTAATLALPRDKISTMVRNITKLGNEQLRVC